MFWWAFILFLYLLGIPLSLHLVYISVFGVTFLYSGSLWSSLYCGDSSLWVGLYGWLVKVSLGKLVSVFWWSWTSSLWSAVKCPVMSYEMSVVL